MDDFCDFSVVLDERQPFLERLSQLRISKCKVLHFSESHPFFTQTFFRFPSLLRSLKILSDKLSPENFHLLLKDTSPHLREFCAVLPLPILSYVGYPRHFNLRFDNLVKLRLAISTMPNEPVMGPPRFQDKLFHKLITGNDGEDNLPPVIMKKLKYFAIEIRCLGFQQVSRFSSLILSFIARHQKTLKHVDFDMIQGHGMPLNEIRPLLDSDLERIDMLALRKVTTLETLRVVNSTAIGVDIWSQLLAQQKTLRFFETDILPAPIQLYKQMILNCQDKLVHIDIGDITLDFDNDDNDMRQFDASVFQNCHHLKKLTLDKNCLRRRPAGEPPFAEIINLHNLPEYLEELAINYFRLLSDELLILFGSTESGIRRNLKSLTLTQCGDSGEFGVDGSILEKIITLDGISFIEISPLNFTQPEERLKLNAILTTFGYNENHSYFQLSKVSHNFQIQFDDFSP